MKGGKDLLRFIVELAYGWLLAGTRPPKQCEAGSKAERASCMGSPESTCEPTVRITSSNGTTSNTRCCLSPDQGISWSVHRWGEQYRFKRCSVGDYQPRVPRKCPYFSIAELVLSKGRMRSSNEASKSEGSPRSRASDGF